MAIARNYSSHLPYYPQGVAARWLGRAFLRAIRVCLGSRPDGRCFIWYAVGGLTLVVDVVPGHQTTADARERDSDLVGTYELRCSPMTDVG